MLIAGSCSSVSVTGATALFCINSRRQSTESRRNICRQNRPRHGRAMPHHFQQGKRDISKLSDVGIGLRGKRYKHRIEIIRCPRTDVCTLAYFGQFSGRSILLSRCRDPMDDGGPNQAENANANPFGQRGSVAGRPCLGGRAHAVSYRRGSELSSLNPHVSQDFRGEAHENPTQQVHVDEQ